MTHAPSLSGIESGRSGGKGSSPPIGITRAYAGARGTVEPDTKMPFDTKDWLSARRGDATLLGVCPMSEEIVEAALRESTAADDFVPMFIATPRQVDADRGYTGWSQEELLTFLDDQADAVGYDGPIIAARDHGGPYQSTRDRGDPSVSTEAAMEYAKELFVRDLESGFDVLHVDATEDPSVDGALPLDEISRRTTELIDAIEAHREAEGIPPVYYEVGTEEIDGGMTDPADFESFIDRLTADLADAGRSEAIEQLVFVVGQIGTTMRIDMENRFDPSKARDLRDIVEAEDLFLKVHYTDWLDDEDLARFPDLGIGAANVGPEFAAAIVEGLDELEQVEVDALGEDSPERSDFMDVFAGAAVANAPWEKFAPDELAGEELSAFASENRRNIAFCVGRYVFNDPDVLDARETLYRNVREHGAVDDPHEHVVAAVRDAIHRYSVAFNLE